MLKRELIGRLPKAELHTHLDAALRPETMIELADAAGFALPTRDPVQLRRFMRVDNAANLEDYLQRFEYTIPLLQNAEAIERVSYEMVEDAARDRIRRPGAGLRRYREGPSTWVHTGGPRVQHGRDPALRVGRHEPGVDGRAPDPEDAAAVVALSSQAG